MSEARPPERESLLVLLDLAHRARAASSADELAFLLVNDSRLLAPYRQAALWLEDDGVRALSGVIQPERNSPYLQWLNAICRALNASPGERAGPEKVDIQCLPPELSDEWKTWLPEHAVWLPISDLSEGVKGALLLAGDEAIAPHLLGLLSEWVDTWAYAWRAHRRPTTYAWRRLWSEFIGWCRRGSELPFWRRPVARLAAGVFALLLCPVRLTVLAPAELVPGEPAVLRAPLDGVVAQFHVQPNQTVKAGQALFSFDEASLGSRLEVARQALATAEAEYRQFAQLALSDARSKGQLATLLGKIGEKRAEAEFLAGQFERAHVTAPRDGIALFDDASEWIGRPVQTGEKIMRVVAPGDVEIEAWLPIGDGIPLEENAAVDLYLAATPFSAVSGRLRYAAHDAQVRPDGSYAYRLRARLNSASDHRVGLKGTVKVHGSWVPLGYWLVRRPLAAIRQFVAL